MPIHSFPMRSNGRRDDRRMAADDYCYLTTRGRRTGRPHRIEIWYATGGDEASLYLLAGGGRSSDWVQNLLADPNVQVELDASPFPYTGGFEPTGLTTATAKNGSYSIELYDLHGFRQARPEAYEIRVIPDNPPEAELLAWDSSTGPRHFSTG